MVAWLVFELMVRDDKSHIDISKEAAVSGLGS